MYAFVLNQVMSQYDMYGLSVACDICCPDQCQGNQVRLREAEVKVLPVGWDPISSRAADIGYGGYNQANIIVTAVGDGVAAGLPAGLVVGVSAGAISFVLGELSISPSKIAAGINSKQKAGSLESSGAQVWTRVVYNPCWQNQSCLFGLCSRNKWGTDQGGDWKQCSIQADLYSAVDVQKGIPTEISYSNYKVAQKVAPECLASHIALIEGRR